MNLFNNKRKYIIGIGIIILFIVITVILILVFTKKSGNGTCNNKKISYNINCPKNCSGNGTCDNTKGICLCNTGFSLPDCSKELISFNILQYNIQLDFTIYISEGGDIRSERIPIESSKINNGDIDVITICEAFQKEYREKIWDGFSKLGWKYHTDVLNSSVFQPNGGVTIVSKWPIVKTDQHIYKAGIGTDKLASKGCMYVKINKNGKMFNVFATHLQAWNEQADQDTRVLQLKEMKTFAESQQISKNEAVLYSGDFNTDMINTPSEVDQLINTLNSKLPKIIGEQKFTSDPKTNSLVGQDGASSNCDQEYYCSVCWSCGDNDPGQCADKLIGEKCNKPNKIPSIPRCTCCPQEFLDFILYSNEYLQPIDGCTIEPIKLKTTPYRTTSWHIGWTTHPYFCTDDLSDHYPIIGKFNFPI